MSDPNSAFPTANPEDVRCGDCDMPRRIHGLRDCYGFVEPLVTPSQMHSGGVRVDAAAGLVELRGPAAAPQEEALPFATDASKDSRSVSIGSSVVEAMAGGGEVQRCSWCCAVGVPLVTDEDQCLECADQEACGDRMTAGKTKVKCVCGAIKWNVWGFDPMSPCISCGRPDIRVAGFAQPKSPFDPSPRPLEPAQNGFIRCNSCESVVSAAGHECAPQVVASDMGWIISEGRRERAEFAESLLCAMAVDHQRNPHAHAYDVDDIEGRCVFCDAAREGSR